MPRLLLRAGALLAVAMAVTACGGGNPAPTTLPPATPDPGLLTNQEVKEMTAGYLNVVAWTELVSRHAAASPDLLPQALMTSPDRQCADAYQRQAPLGTETALPELERCIAAGFDRHDPEQWYRLPPEHRHARASLAIRYLWESIDYRPVVAVQLANDAGVNILLTEDDEYRAMTELYAPSETRNPHWSQELADAPTPAQTAQVWLDAHQALTHCVNEATDYLFSATGDTAIPAATPESYPEPF